MIELNESNFAENTNSGLVLVDFYAPWCGPCRMVTPILEQLTDVKVVKVNIDDNSEISSSYRVESIPCLVFLKDGREIDRLVGLRDKKTLQAKVDYHK